MNKTILISIIVLFVVACNPIKGFAPTYYFKVEICKNPTEAIGIEIPQSTVNMDSLLIWLAPYQSKHDQNVYKFYCYSLEIRRAPSTVRVKAVGYGVETNEVFAIDKLFFLVLSDFENIKLENIVVNFIIK